MKGTLTHIQQSDENEREQFRGWEKRDVCFPKFKTDERWGSCRPWWTGWHFEKNVVCIVLVPTIHFSKKRA